jgi:hypothetical protein
MATVIGRFFIITANGALMSSIRVLPSVGAVLQHMLDAELFLWPQSVPDREHASPVTMPNWASLMEMVHLTLAVY